jgi:hypothetical protein
LATFVSIAKVLGAQVMKACRERKENFSKLSIGVLIYWSNFLLFVLQLWLCPLTICQDQKHWCLRSSPVISNSWMGLLMSLAATATETSMAKVMQFGALFHSSFFPLGICFYILTMYSNAQFLTLYFWNII